MIRSRMKKGLGAYVVRRAKSTNAVEKAYTFKLIHQPTERVVMIEYSNSPFTPRRMLHKQAVLNSACLTI